MIAFVALIPLTLLTLIIVGGGESAAAAWVSVVGVVGLVTSAALGARALGPLIVFTVCAIAQFFVLAATWIPVKIESERELRSAAHGYPVAWVTVEHYWDPPSYPRTWGWNPWEEPATAEDGRYLASFVLVFAPLLVLTGGLIAFSRKLRRA